MKPLLSYYGGKQRMASHILPIIESIPHTVYVEPFCGGAALLFAKVRVEVSSSNHYREVINDINGLIANFYRVAKLRSEELIAQIDATLYSRSDFAKSCEIWKNPNDYTDLEKAWAVFVCLNQSFAHVAGGGWGVAVVSQNHAATWDNRKAQLAAQCKRISYVYIECRDALEVIKQWDSPQTLFYCDPPYPGTDQGHYGGYTVDHYNALVDTLEQCQGSWILSNYQQDREPKGSQKIEIQAYASSSKKGKAGKNRDKSRAATPEEIGNRLRTESLWVKRSDASMRSELLSLTRRPKKISLFEEVRSNDPSL